MGYLSLFGESVKPSVGNQMEDNSDGKLYRKLYPQRA